MHFSSNRDEEWASIQCTFPHQLACRNGWAFGGNCKGHSSFNAGGLPNLTRNGPIPPPPHFPSEDLHDPYQHPTCALSEPQINSPCPLGHDIPNYSGNRRGWRSIFLVQGSPTSSQIVRVNGIASWACTPIFFACRAMHNMWAWCAAVRWIGKCVVCFCRWNVVPLHPLSNAQNTCVVKCSGCSLVGCGKVWWCSVRLHMVP